MELLNELSNFINEEEDERRFEEGEIKLIVDYAMKVMAQQHKNEFDDEVYATIAKRFGDGYLVDKLDRVIENLGVENKLQ